MIELIVYALAAAAITMTITRSSLFKPVRINKLLKCPYCFVHWVTFPMAAMTTTSFLDFIITVFALVTLSVPGMFLIELFMDKIDEE